METKLGKFLIGPQISQIADMLIGNYYIKFSKDL